MKTEAEVLRESFIRRLGQGDLPVCGISDFKEYGLALELLTEMFESQLLSRCLDLHSRELQKRGESFYTIGSSGHEGNAAIAAALRVSDMAFLHYRDAAFYIQRSKQLAGQDPAYDLMLSFAASSSDPISGGRHKVLGSKALNIPPQTSTIASHLPKAVGAAASIGLNRRLKREGELPAGSLVVCSFGDASLNHSTAQGAINTASWMAYRKMHLPILFVCEDNGIGISVPTPPGWVEESIKSKPGIRYFSCDGLNLLDTYRAACEAERYIRQHHMPAFLHMRCVRLLGHAGSDVQSVYLSDAQIQQQFDSDPLLMSAALLIENGLLSAEKIISLHEEISRKVEEAGERAISQPKLTTADAVMKSLIPPVRDKVSACSSKQMNKSFAEAEKSSIDKEQPLSRILNLALHELMHEHDNIILAGEDIGRKGGVYGVTIKLSSRFGEHRVIDTLLDEQTILGLGIGLGHNGLLPIPEIQFLAYLHNAEDQLRGEASTLSFFSNGQYTNPMVIRVAGLAYQRGFGGHFHNDNSIAVLRDIPGIIVACPSSGDEAVPLLRECVRLALEEQRVVVFLEPIALYTIRDLHKEGDSLWCTSYRKAREAGAISFGEVQVTGNGKDLAIVTYGNGFYLSLQAAMELKKKHGVKCRVINLRWLNPLPMEAVLRAIEGCHSMLVVDECRETGSLSEELMSKLYEQGKGKVRLARHCAKDCFIPLGKAATLTLPSKNSIIQAATDLLKP